MRILFILFFLILASCSNSSTELEEDTASNPMVPEVDGLDKSLLETAIVNARNATNFYALAVIKDENVVVEEYFRSKNSNTLFQIRSITKNFTSALAGIAIDQGVLSNLDMQIKEVYPSLTLGSKCDITLRHLLNMSSGLIWNEQQEVVDLLEGRIEDPITDFLSRELEYSPGTNFNYNTLSTHIVGNLIEINSGNTFKAFAKTHLLAPLEIDSFSWETDFDGRVWGGTGLGLKMADVAKFGQLYLNKGSWNGEQLVPQEWVALSATEQISIPQSSSGYGLQWYVAENLDKKVFFGQGYGGQALMLIPDENMMIIAFQEHLVNNEQHMAQWNNFLNLVFTPIYQAIE